MLIYESRIGQLPEVYGFTPLWALFPDNTAKMEGVPAPWLPIGLKFEVRASLESDIVMMYLAGEVEKHR